MARYKAPYRLIKPSKTRRAYYFRLCNDDKRTMHTTGCKTEKEARAFCEKLIEANSRARSEVLFEDYTKDFFVAGKCSYLQSREDEDRPISEKLMKDYRAYLANYLIPYFGKIPVQKITAAMIRQWRSELKQGISLPTHMNHPPANATLNHVRRILKVIFDQAEEEQIITINPVLKVCALSKKVKKERDAFNIEDINKLFPKSEKSLLKVWKSIEMASMQYLALTGGLRSGEIRALRWSDIDFQKKGVRILRAIKADNKIGVPKGKKSRGSTLPNRAITLLRKWKKISGCTNDDSLVYPGRDGESHSCSDRLRYALDKAMEITRINCNGERNLVVHSHRHTYNTKMETIFPTEILHMVIGHESNEMTDNYDHLTPDEELNIVNRTYRHAIEEAWK